MSAEIFAGLCILALGGWAWSLVAFSRSSLPMANTLKTLNAVDTLVDERIARTFERIRARRERGAIKAASQRAQPETGPERVDPMREIFGGPPIDPQPDADDEGLEVVEG